MAVNATTATNTGQGLGTSVSSATQLTMDFLKLLTVQLANQDPLSPMDNQAMVEQLATFSQLEQLEGVNNKLETSMQYTQSLSNTMMMNLVGKRVTVLGNEIKIESGSPSRSLVRTAAPGVGTAQIVDANGEVVRTIEGIRLQSGFSEIAWDGLDDEGNALADGDYTMRFEAEDADGAFMSLAIFQSGIVDTIQYDNNFQTLIVNGQVYLPADVVEVGVAPTVVTTVSEGTGGDDDDSTETVEDPDPGSPPVTDPGPGNVGGGDKDGINT